MKGLIHKLKTDRKFSIRFFGILGAVILLLAAAFYTLLIKPNQEKDRYVYKETKVAYGTLVKAIVESGSVSLENHSVDYEIDLSSDEDEDQEDEDQDEDEDETTARYLVIQDIYVASGQRVEAGDKLLQFTQDSVEAVRRKLTSEKTEAQIALSLAESERNLNKLSAESAYSGSVEKANSAGTIYQATLSSLEAEISGYRADIEILKDEIATLTEELQEEDLYTDRSEAYRKYQHAKEKLDETDVHNADAYTNNVSSYESAKATYESADAAITDRQDSIQEKTEEISQLEKKITDAEANLSVNKMKAKQTYDTAKMNGETAESIREYTVASLNTTVENARETMDEATKKLETFENFVGTDGILYADASGMISGVNYEAGDKLTTTGTLLTYVTSDSYTISIDVLEEDVPSIAVGNTVSITFAAYEEEPYTGTISSISTIASSDSGIVSYPVTIHIEGDTSKLYGGMTADVSFVTDEAKDVLYVSRKAIVNENGTTNVYIKQGNRYVLTPVQTGFTDGTQVEIVSGLKEGDTVYIASKVKQEEASSETDSNGSTSPQLEQNNGEMPSGEMPGGGFPGGEMPGGGFPGGGMPGGGFPGGGMPGAGPSGNGNGGGPGGF